MKEIYILEYYDDAEIIAYPTMEDARHVLLEDYLAHFYVRYDYILRGYPEEYKSHIQKDLKDIYEDLSSLLLAKEPFLIDYAGCRKIPFIEKEDKK